MTNKHKFANSSSIEHCDFVEPDTLKIKFISSSKEHEYPNCPKSIYEGLRAAESPGKYFHASIRKQYLPKP